MASHNVNMQNTFFAKIKPYRFRILAGVLFCVFLISTWFVFHEKPHFPEALHITLQEQFRSIVQEKLAEQKPEARNLHFQKLWTEGTKRDQITAHFQYSFNDEAGVSFSVSGKAVMNRKSIDPERNHDLWTVDHIETSNTGLEFEEPIILFSGNVKIDPDKEENPEETPTDTSEKEEEEIDQKEEVPQEEAKPSKEEQENKPEKVQEPKDKKEKIPKENKKAPQEEQKDEKKTTEENKQNETAQEIKPSEKEDVKPTDKAQEPSAE